MVCPYRLPEDVFSLLRKSPAEFIGELRLAAAVKWFELGLISPAKAAELAGISRQEFLNALHRFMVSPFQITSEELAREAADAEKVGCKRISTHSSGQD